MNIEAKIALTSAIVLMVCLFLTKSDDYGKKDILSSTIAVFGVLSLVTIIGCAIYAIWR